MKTNTREVSMSWWTRLSGDKMENLSIKYFNKSRFYLDWEQIDEIYNKEAQTSPTFTTDNCNNLKQTCNKISNLMEENVEGSLMYSQMLFLGELIKEFTENPIVKNSGIVK